MIGQPSKVPFPVRDAPVPSTSTLPQLPPGHFLAQRAVEPQPILDHHVDDQFGLGTERHDRARPDTSSLAAADFDIDVRTGFLPPEEPVQSIQHLGNGWDSFEQALDRARLFVCGLRGGGVGKIPEAWRDQVRQLPAPDLSLLNSLPLLRRAHVLLSFLGHFYVHSTYPSSTTIPPAIARPWIAVSDKLGMPPVLTYADTVLWNWHFIDSRKGLVPGNVSITTTFTSSRSEISFFLLSLLCELQAAALLRQVSATLDESFFADAISLRRIAGHLVEIRHLISHLTKLMQEATAGPFGPAGQGHLEPADFYWEIRPWFNGGEWEFDLGGVDQGGVRKMHLGGPSAGQSSLIHALDLWLGIDHRPSPASTSAEVGTSTQPGTSTETTKQKQASSSWDDTFMMRMAAYMPAHHRHFLTHLSNLHTRSPTNEYPLPSLRQLAQHDKALGRAYDETIETMRKFRDMHMRLVAVYIIAQASKQPPAGCVLPAKKSKRVAYGESMDEKGTGGTELSSFLKMCRDRTVEAIVGLTNGARN